MNRLKIRYITTLLFTITMFGAIYSQNTDSLKQYVEIAGLNNPGVIADFMTYKATLQKVPQAGAYQDPEFEIGFFLEPMELIGGKQVAQFKLMQMFPWFGTKKSAQNEAVYMAKIAFEKFRNTRDNLYLQVYTQWYVLCNLQQQLNNNRENKILLNQLEQLSMRKFSSSSTGQTTTYSSFPITKSTSSKTSSSRSSKMSEMTSMDKENTPASAQSSKTTSMSSSNSMSGEMSNKTSGGMSNVLRIQLEIAELDNNIESIISEMKAEKAKFNVFLNRSSDSEIQIPNTFAAIPFLFDTEKFITAIEEQNPMLSIINEEKNAYKAKTELDKKMSYPMFGIGLQYMLNNKTNMSAFAMGNMNGKDMVMPMVSVSIPLYRNKYKAQQRESKLLQQASKEKYADTYNQLTAELYQSKHMLDDASRKIILYKKQTELAKTTYNLIVQEFVAGKSDLTNVIQVQRQLLNYQLKASEAVANYNTMVASIQKLISFKNTEKNTNAIYYGNK